MPARVQGICAADRDQRAVGGRLADRTQQPDGLGQRELLAAHAADEIAAADFPAGFQPPVKPAEFQPRDFQRFTLEHPAEDDAITPEQHPREGLDGLFAGLRFRFLRDGRPQQRPAPGEFHARDGFVMPVRPSADANGARFSAGTSKARKPSKLSAVTQPQATSSASERSTREGSEPVCRTISAKKSAPERARTSQTCWVSEEKSPGLGRGGQREPMRLIFARENRHRAGAHGRRGRTFGARWKGQPPPADAPGKQN